MLTFLWYPKLNQSLSWGPAIAIFQPTTDCISLVHETIPLPCIISCATLWQSTGGSLCASSTALWWVQSELLPEPPNPLPPHIQPNSPSPGRSWGQQSCALSHVCHQLPSSLCVRQLELLGKVGLESFLMQNGNCFPMKSFQQNVLFPH